MLSRGTQEIKNVCLQRRLPGQGSIRISRKKYNMNMKNRFYVSASMCGNMNDSTYLQMGVCVQTCTYVQVHIHTYILTYTNKCTYTYTYTYKYIHTHRHAFLETFCHPCRRTYVQVYTYVYVHIFVGWTGPSVTQAFPGDRVAG